LNRRGDLTTDQFFADRSFQSLSGSGYVCPLLDTLAGALHQSLRDFRQKLGKRVEKLTLKPTIREAFLYSLFCVLEKVFAMVYLATPSYSRWVHVVALSAPERSGRAAPPPPAFY
jgi:hypothetical protein